jgi:hypothetical protein
MPQYFWTAKGFQGEGKVMFFGAAFKMGYFW